MSRPAHDHRDNDAIVQPDRPSMDASHGVADTDHSHQHDRLGGDGHGDQGHDGHGHDGHGQGDHGQGDHGRGGHAGHDHGVAADADRRWLTIALVLIVGFMLAEVTVGWWARSLALLSDAAHMLTDAGAIALALIAARLAARPPKGGYTFGLKRAEILSAQANGLTMLLLAAWLGVEAVRRLLNPPPVAGGLVLVTALAGIVVNVAAAWAMSKANRTSLNVEGAFQHILNDLFAFIATAIAGLVMLLTGFNRADGIATLVVVALMVKAGVGLVRASGRILLQAAPDTVDLAGIRRHLLEVDHVHDVHDLHVWTVTSNLPTLSAHVVIDDSCFTDSHAPQLLDELQTCLTGHFDVEHSTFQLETASHAAHEPGTHT